MNAPELKESLKQAFSWGFTAGSTGQRKRKFIRNPKMVVSKAEREALEEAHSEGFFFGRHTTRNIKEWMRLTVGAIYYDFREAKK